MNKKKVADPIATLKLKAKLTQAIDAMVVYKEVSNATYMESIDDVDNCINVLRGKLTELVKSNHKVRIK